MHERGEKLALKFEVAALFGFEAVEPARNIFRFNGPFHEKPLLRDFFIYCRPFGLGGNKKLFCCFRYDALRNCVPDIGKTLVDLGELPLKLAQSGEVYIFIGGNAFHLAGDISSVSMASVFSNTRFSILSFGTFFFLQLWKRFFSLHA